MTFTVAGQEEIFEPGDTFYVPPGHLQRAEAGTEYLQFSLAKENAEVEQQIMRNMEACSRPSLVQNSEGAQPHREAPRVVAPEGHPPSVLI